MNQRRILIGSMIGVFIFTLMSLISNDSWSSLENQVIQGRSFLKFFDKDPDFVVLEFPETAKFDFFANNIENQRQTIINLISEASLGDPTAIYLLIRNDNPMMFEEFELQQKIDDGFGKIEITKFNEIETKIKDDKNRTFILDQKIHKFEIINSEKINSGNFQSQNLKNKKVIVVSPYLKTNKAEINELINFLDSRWLRLIQIPTLVLLFLCMGFGILFATLINWARIALFFIITILVLIVGQIAFSFFNIDLETVPFLVSMLGILLIANLFDLNLAAIYRREIFKDQVSNDNSKLLSEKSIPEIINEQTKKKEEKIASASVIKEMRAKFFNEQESNYEDIALNFEEKTVKSIHNIQEKFEELLDSTELNDKDKVKIDIIRHNFNYMIEEIDAILFNLVPFRFEGNGGLINLLELFAGKVFTLSKGKIQIQIESDIPSLKLELNQKINSYRIIQNLIELIKENNHDKVISGLNIGIDIANDTNGMIKFHISYEGKAINTTANSYKLKEIYKRLDGLDGGSLDLGDTLAGISSNLTNHLILKIKSPNFNLLQAANN